MTTSTRSPEKLRAPGRLAPLCRSIAVLDLLLFPDDWESRYHSFTPEWARGESTFSMRDGQGDHFTIWFPKIGGAAIRGFAHESPMSPWSSVRAKASKPAKTDNKKKASADENTITKAKKSASAKPNSNDDPEPWENIFAGLPKSFDLIRTEPSFGGNEVSFCLWWSREHEMKWRVGDGLIFSSGNDPDGSAELLNILDGHAATYARWASDYCERKIPLNIVKKIYAHKPLSEADVVAINPDATLDDVREEVTSLGYRIKGDTKRDGGPGAKKPADKSGIASTSSNANKVRFEAAPMLPIGVVRSSRADVKDDLWDAETSRIELDSSRFDAEALHGLDTFSHAEIIYLLDRVEDSKIEMGARHPRNNEAWPKVGIFAQRGKNRPNRIGSTVCKIAKVAGTALHVKGLDAVDGTPVLDIKPWVRELGPRGALKQPKWITSLMKHYWD